jgi:hypothetical protein
MLERCSRHAVPGRPPATTAGGTCGTKTWFIRRRPRGRAEPESGGIPGAAAGQCTDRGQPDLLPPQHHSLVV